MRTQMHMYGSNLPLLPQLPAYRKRRLTPCAGYWHRPQPDPACVVRSHGKHHKRLLYRCLTINSVPPNVHFIIDDAEDDWEFSAPYDFIFSRLLTGGIKDWPRLFRQGFEYVPQALLLSRFR